MDADSKTTLSSESRTRLGFDEFLLLGVVALVIAGVMLVIGWYVLFSEGRTVPETRDAVRVSSVEDFPVGASRVQNWGNRIILVVRAGETEYSALQATAPTDGCILEWDAESSRVVSPCSYLVYDLNGNVVAGLTTQPPRPYSVFIRDGVVYLTDG
jgi:nitrite reductase/ring-hydroxylating ferredoxin subunit